jgi:hypothetical protein
MFLATLRYKTIGVEFGKLKFKVGDVHSRKSRRIQIYQDGYQSS